MRRKRILVAAACVCLVFGFVVWSVAPMLRSLPRSRPSTKILARDGSLLYELRKPDGGSAEPVPLARIPPSLREAVRVSEDARFFSHHGVDWIAIGREIQNRLFRRASGGASTIEMQLVKNLYFRGTPRTLVQKLREMIAATAWSIAHTKDETLERYLNTVSFGTDTVGASAAARQLFHTDVSDLTIGESALLAALIPSPSRYDPIRHRAVAFKRQARVLERMHAASDTSDVVLFAPRHPITAPHFVFRVLDELEEKLPDLRDGGYLIRTTLDPRLQRIAEEVVTRRLLRLLDKKVSNAAVVAIDPVNGDTLAYIGSAEYFDAAIHGQVDMARALRQPGSTLKPFLYFIALERGATPATVLSDVPVRFETERGESYYPHNYNNRLFGPVTIRDALGSSLNIPAVKMLQTIGAPVFFETLASFGLTFPKTPSHYGLSIVLGGGEVTLFDLTHAYGILARFGENVPSRTVLDIRDASGHIIFREIVPPARPISSNTMKMRQSAALIADILADPEARSRSFGETSLLDVGRRVAVKTGTTKDFRDNLAVGYTPDFALGVWVGNADNAPMFGVSGLTGAIPIWHDIMEKIVKSQKSITSKVIWPDTPGIVTRRICLPSGLLATERCPKQRIEKFIAGTEPTHIDDWYIFCQGTTYLQPPAEYAAWIAAAGYEEPPAFCGGVSASTSTPQILAPLDGEVFIRDAQVAPDMQRVAFIASGKTARVWVLNGTRITARDSMHLWNPEPGSYTLALEGAAGQIHFTVR